MSRLSLRARLLLAATLTLIAFLGIAGVGLDRAFKSSAEVTVRNQFRTQINALLTVLEIDALGRLVMPERLPEPRLTLPNSGLYGVILDADGRVLWRSQSSIGIALDFARVAEPGVETFHQVGGELDSPFYYSFGISWELDSLRTVTLSLVLYNESSDFSQTVRSHRGVLTFWLSLAGVFLLIVQATTLRWGLSPMRQVAREMDLIERARQSSIEGTYPKEIAQLSRRINLFMQNERRNQERYRNTLGDLAHSLKTPLAVIRGLKESADRIDRHELGEQVERMNKIVEYQLKRASSTHFSVVHAAVDVAPVVHKISTSLQKVYAGKSLQMDSDLAGESLFFGDEGDLYELLGNLMENAAKWAASRVLVRTENHQHSGDLRSSLALEVHDDGPGIPAAERGQVLQRGVRADRQTPGQGIGLAVVREIVERYDGDMELADSELGGALVRVYFPSALANDAARG